MERAQLEKKYGKYVELGCRKVRRFIPYPIQIRDGTYRCIRCGQIDDQPYHIREACQDAMS